MALLQISDPQRPATQPAARRCAVGIDLGTTNSLVATMDEARDGESTGSAQLLRCDGDAVLMPSAVRYLPGGGVSVGAAAWRAAPEDPANTLLSVKRLIGRSLAEARASRSAFAYQLAERDGALGIETRAGAVTPQEASAELLRALAERASAALGRPVEGAVITVPAYFDETQRQATRDAARLAGLNLLRLLNEPTAAAVACGLDDGTPRLIAVYDLGGGTFDLSVLRFHQGVFEVLATGGDTALGGDDFDATIADWARSRGAPGDPEDPGAQRRLLLAARVAKETLSREASCALRLDSWSETLARATFADAVAPMVARTLDIAERTLRDAEVDRATLDALVLVGGATRAPAVRDAVAAWLGRAPMIHPRPESVVALGAAMQADVLIGNRPDSDQLLLDVTPLSLGIEVMGGMVERIIPRNTPVPAHITQEFTTSHDGQTGIAVHVVQGEREMVSACRSLARFELVGLAPRPAGAVRVGVTFRIDADGLLNVGAQERDGAAAAEVVVKPSYGLSEARVAEMLRQAWQRAGEDAGERALRAARNEAELLARALRAALAQDGQLYYDEAGRAEMERAIAELADAIEGEDAEHIRAATERANQQSEPFAEWRMRRDIQSALGGQHMDAVDPDAAGRSLPGPAS